MSNIFKFELKTSWKTIIYWALGLMLFIGICISVYPGFSKDMSQLTTMINAMPKTFVDLFNIDLSLWSEFSGFYVYIMTYVSLVLFLYGILGALKMFNKEYKNKSIEFLFTKPKNRAQIYNGKVFSIIVLDIILWCLVSVLTIVMAYLFIDNFKVLNYLEVQFPLLIIMIIASLIGIVFAILFNRIKIVSSVGFSIGFIFFFLALLGNILKDQKLEFISIFGLFKGSDIILNGYSALPFFISGILIVLLYFGGLILYKRKDVL